MCVLSGIFFVFSVFVCVFYAASLCAPDNRRALPLNAVAVSHQTVTGLPGEHASPGCGGSDPVVTPYGGGGEAGVFFNDRLKGQTLTVTTTTTKNTFVF